MIGLSECADDRYTASVAAAAVYAGDAAWDEADPMKPGDVVQALADGGIVAVGERERQALRIMIGVLQRNSERRKAATAALQQAQRSGEVRRAAVDELVANGPGEERPDPTSVTAWRKERGELRMALTLAVQARDRNARLLREAREARASGVTGETRARIKAEAAEQVEQARRAAREAWEFARQRQGCGKVPLRTSAEATLFVDLVCRQAGEDVTDWNVYPCETCVWPSASPWRDAPVWHGGHATPRALRERAAILERTGGERPISLAEAAARLGGAAASG